MKKVLFALTILIPSLSFGKTITITFSDEDQKIVEYYVVDFEQWIREAVVNKIASRRKALGKEVIDTKIQKRETLSGTQDKIIKDFIDSPDYKTRKQRDLTGK